jgi:hypothetical protein
MISVASLGVTDDQQELGWVQSRLRELMSLAFVAPRKIAEDSWWFGQDGILALKDSQGKVQQRHVAIISMNVRIVADSPGACDAGMC